MIGKLMNKGFSGRIGIESFKVAAAATIFVLAAVLSSGVNSAEAGCAKACCGGAKADSGGDGNGNGNGNGNGGSGKAKAARKDYVAEAKAAIEKADPVMGDWQGSWKLDDGSDSGPLVAQVIALGKGEYRVNVLEVFDRRVEQPISVLEGRLADGAVRMTGRARHDGREFDVKAAIKGGKFTGNFKGEGVGTFAMERVFRVSRTMGAKPPKGAIVLFNGRNVKEWKRAKVKPGEDDTVKWELVGGAMRVTRGPGGGNIITRKKFNDLKLHIEFRTPFMPEKRGQGRGNSGVYLQGRYECQVLDSYGLEGKDNECGGIYKVRPPRVNMCAPPTQWQTYDITFLAPKFDGDGKLTKKATMTVLHNGVLIQDKTPVGGSTTASLGGKASEPAGVYLQDHGNKVEYRNIWVVEL